MGPDGLPDAAGMEREDRREVVPRGPGEPEPVLLWAGLRALVGAHEPRAVVRHANARHEAAPHETGAVRRRVLLRKRPDRRLAVGGEDAVELQRLERLRGVLVGIATRGRLGEVDFDHVQR